MVRFQICTSPQIWGGVTASDFFVLRLRRLPEGERREGIRQKLSLPTVKAGCGFCLSYRRSVVGRLTARVTRYMHAVNRFMVASPPGASPVLALGTLSPRAHSGRSQWPTHAGIGNVHQGKKSASPQNTLTHTARVDNAEWECGGVRQVVAPFALQRVAAPYTIDLNATPKPVLRTFARKASEFQLRGFSLSGVCFSLCPFGSRPLAIELSS